MFAIEINPAYKTHCKKYGFQWPLSNKCLLTISIIVKEYLKIPKKFLEFKEKVKSHYFDLGYWRFFKYNRTFNSVALVGTLLIYLKKDFIEPKVVK